MKIQSIRPFIGSSNFKLSRKFYADLGFSEVALSPKMSYFKKEEFGFYLQDYFAKDWIDNSMVFLEVDDVSQTLQALKNLELTKKYPTVRLSEIVYQDWGCEFFLHDPDGILWHIGAFNQ